MSSSNEHDPRKRQYHIGLAPGEVAPWVLLVGDPDRTEAVAKRFDEVGPRRQCREFASYTGRYHGLEITVLGTGIGCDNTEIAVLELLECQPKPTLLRVGSCGALHGDLAIGDLAITTAAVRLESTSLGFVESGYPAHAHHEVVLALISAAEERRAPYTSGITATASGFYGWQGRQGMAVEPRNPGHLDQLRTMRVVNFEMESSTLFTLASLAGVRAGTICTVFANRERQQMIAKEQKAAAVDRAIDVALRAVEYLAKMDSLAQQGPFHLAGLLAVDES